MSHIFQQQSSLHEETARLDQTCQALGAADRQRAEELAELSEIFNRVKHQSSASTAGVSAQLCRPLVELNSVSVHRVSADVPAHAQASINTPAHGNRRLGSSGSPLSGQEWDLSPGGRTRIPRVVESSLGALSSANRVLSAFQDELNSGLIQLTLQADEARRTAFTAKAHVDFLHQLVSPRKAGAEASSPLGMGWSNAASGATGQTGTPNPEIASLLRVLQEAAEQRVLAETSLRSPPARGTAGIWSEDLLRPGSPHSPTAAARTSGSPEGWEPRFRSGDGGQSEAVETAYMGAVGTPGPSRQSRQLLAQLDEEEVAEAQPRSAFMDPQAPPERAFWEQQYAEPAGRTSQQEQQRSREAGGLLDEELRKQTDQLRMLQIGVQELEARRKDLVASLEDTASKVSSCSIELEAVRAELETAKAELEEQKQYMQVLSEQRHVAEQRLQDKLQQLQQLDALVQASAAQLAEMQARLAVATAASPDLATSSPAGATGGTGATAAGQSQGSSSGHHRTKLRVKRHQPVRRSHSCSDFSARLAGHQHSQQRPSSPESQQAELGRTASGSFTRPTLATGAESSGMSSSSTSSAPEAQLASLQRELESLTAEHCKVLHQLEQERHASMAHQGELVALRQRLRAHQMTSIASSSNASGSGDSRSSGATLKRPLSSAMSGMEDILEEAAADLEQLEGHVANVTQRLLDLQAQNMRLAQQVAAALQTKAAAEAAASDELQRLKGLREEAEAVQRSTASSQLSSVRLAAEVSAAHAELRQLEERVAEQQAQLQQCRRLAQEHEERLQEVQRRILQEDHGREVAEQARKAAEHQLEQLQARLEEVQQRTQQSEHEGAAVRTEAEDLAAEVEKARGEWNQAREELEQLRRQAKDRQAELAALTDAVATARQERATEAEAAAMAAKSREDAEAKLQAFTAQLESAQNQRQQCELDVQELQAQLAAHRQEHQDLSTATERHKEQAAAAASQGAAAQLELEAAQAQVLACREQREEAEQELQGRLEELQRLRKQIQQGEAEADDVESQLMKLRQEQQELASVVERSEQRAAAAERRAAATEQDLQATREQMRLAQQQLAEAAAQVAALRRSSASGTTAFDDGSSAYMNLAVQPTPGAEPDLGLGHFTAPSAQHAPGLRNSTFGHLASQQHLATILQLQSELDRQQVILVQAQSRQRLAEQRASDAEQLNNELQARLNTMRAQQQALRADVDSQSTSSSSAAMQIWRIKADELQQEVESAQHMLGRYKARLAAAQDECSGLEEGLQREKAASSRLRQQVEGLQEELQAAKARLRTAEDMLANQQQQQQQAELLRSAQRLTNAAASGHHGSPAAAGGTPPAAAASTAAAAAMSTITSPARGDQVEQARQQLRMLQDRIAHQEKVNAELLEAHASLQRVGAEMQSQLEEAANQLVTLREQFEKGKRKVESLHEQRTDLQERVAALAAQEQQVLARLGELQQQASVHQSGATALQQAALRAQQELHGLRSQIADAQQALAAALAQRDVALAEAAEAERRARAAQAQAQAQAAAVAQSPRAWGSPQPWAQEAAIGPASAAADAASAELVRGLEQQLAAVRQAQAVAEESLAEERRQLQQCKAELAAALTVRAAHEAATARLQQDLEKLQAQVSHLQASKFDGQQGGPSATALDAVAGPPSAAATPAAPARTLALTPRDAVASTPGMGEPSPGSATSLAIRSAAAAAPTTVWNGTPAELATARRELHGLELRIAVATADEARLAAACSELRRQQSAAELELATVRQQVAEAEHRLAALQADMGQGTREAADWAAERGDLRSAVRSLQQQVHAAETAEADARHQAQLASMRAVHMEEQLRVVQQQAAQQAQAHAARLDDALVECERERQRAVDLQERIAALKQELQQQRAALAAQAQDYAAQREAAAREHAAQLAALEDARSRDAAAADALAAARSEISELQAETERQSVKLAEEGSAKQQLCLEIARSGQTLAEARAEAERLHGQIAQLTAQLAEADRARVLMVSESARNAEALAAAEARSEGLQAEAQDLAGRLSIVERAYSQLRAESRELSVELEDSREERRLAQDRAARLEVSLSVTEAAAEQLRLQLEQAKAMADLETTAVQHQGGSGFEWASSDAAAQQPAGAPQDQGAGLRSTPPAPSIAAAELPQPGQLSLHHAAMAQLLADCNALREQRDTAVAELQQAAVALAASDGRAGELARANDHLKDEVARLQRLVVAATAAVEHMQEEHQLQSARQRPPTTTQSVQTEWDATAAGAAGAADSSRSVQADMPATGDSAQRTAAEALSSGAGGQVGASASQVESAAYAVLMGALKNHASMERQVASLQDELQAALAAKSELEMDVRRLQEKLSQAQRPPPLQPSGEGDNSTVRKVTDVPPAETDASSEPTAATNTVAPPATTPQPEVEQMRRQVEELADALQRAHADASASAEKQAALAHTREEELARALADARAMEMQARQALDAALAEAATLAGQLAGLREELQAERAQREELEHKLVSRPPASDGGALGSESSSDVTVSREPATQPPLEELDGGYPTLGQQNSGSNPGAASAPAWRGRPVPSPPGSFEAAPGARELVLSGAESGGSQALESDRAAESWSLVPVPSPLSARILEVELELDRTRRQLAAADASVREREQLQARLDAVLEQHGQEVQARRSEELRRLQNVREEYGRLEQQLQAELQRALAAAAHSTSELRDVKDALRQAERQASEAVQEALKSSQQAAAYQAQLRALQQRLENRQEPPLAGGGSNGHSQIAGGRSASSGSLGSQGGGVYQRTSQASSLSSAGIPRALSDGGGDGGGSGGGSGAAAGSRLQALVASAPMVKMPAAPGVPGAGPSGQCAAPVVGGAPIAKASTMESEGHGGERKLLEAELQQLRRQCAALDKQCATQKEELQRGQAKLSSVEGRLAAAVKQVEALNDELRTRERAVADDLKLRVAQQADTDARLLCELRCQLRDCQERLERSKEELGQARAELQAARAEAQAHAHAQVLRSPARTQPEVLPGPGRGARLATATQRPVGGGEAADESLPGQDGDAEAGALRRARLASAAAVEAAVRRVVSVLAGGSGHSPADDDGELAATAAARLGGGTGDSGGVSDNVLGLRLAAFPTQPHASPSANISARSQLRGRQLAPRKPSYSWRSGAFGDYDSDADLDEAYAELSSELGSSALEGLGIVDLLSDELLDLLQIRLMPGRVADPQRGHAARGAGGSLLLPVGRQLVVASSSGAGPRRCTSAACQTDPAPEYGALVPLSRVSAATSHLSELQQQQSELLSRVAALRCQAAEAEALASARTARVAELRTREQQLASVCASLQRQAEDSLQQLQDNFERCKALADETRDALEADCEQLRALREDLTADVQQTQSLLRESLLALRLGRVSLQAHRAVDAALANLTAAATKDPGGVGSQALQHVKVVFSCMAELCGRAEALASAVGPLVTQLGAVASSRSQAAPCDPWAARAPEDTPVAARRGARPAESPRRGRLDEDHSRGAPGFGASRAVREEVTSMVARERATRGHGVEAAPRAVTTAGTAAEVQRALKRAYQQLNARARKFGKVLKAMEAGEQLSVEALQEGFQRLWSSAEEQLGGLMRMTGGGGAGEAEPPLQYHSPRGDTSPSHSGRLDAVAAAAAALPNSPSVVSSGTRAKENAASDVRGPPAVNTSTVPSVGTSVPPSSRPPLAAVDNVLEEATNLVAQSRYKRGGASSAPAANRRVPSGKTPLEGGPGPTGLRQGADAAAVARQQHHHQGHSQQAQMLPQTQPQPQRWLPLSPRGAPSGSPSTGARPLQQRRQPQQQPQPLASASWGVGREVLLNRPVVNAPAPAAAGSRGIAGLIPGPGEGPNRRSVDLQLLQVLSLAKELQSKPR